MVKETANRPGSVWKRFVSLQVYRGLAGSVVRSAPAVRSGPVLAERTEAMLRGVCCSRVKVDEGLAVTVVLADLQPRPCPVRGAGEYPLRICVRHPLNMGETVGFSIRNFGRLLIRGLVFGLGLLFLLLLLFLMEWSPPTSNGIEVPKWRWLMST